MTGINKGKPRLPQKLNMNSACLLTMRAKGSLEALFWDYFSNDAKLKKWQGSEMKYVSASVIEKVLADMQSLASDEKKEEIAECARYFRQLNRVS